MPPAPPSCLLEVGGWAITIAFACSSPVSSQVCKELRLDIDWFEALNTHIQSRVEEFVEVGGGVGE